MRFQTLHSPKRPADMQGNGYQIQLQDGPQAGREELRAEETASGEQRVLAVENTGNAGNAGTEGLRAEETASGEQCAFTEETESGEQHVSTMENTENAGQVSGGKKQEPERIDGPFRTPEECREQMRELVNRIEEEEMKKYYF